MPIAYNLACNYNKKEKQKDYKSEGNIARKEKGKRQNKSKTNIMISKTR